MAIRRVPGAGIPADHPYGAGGGERMFPGPGGPPPEAPAPPSAPGPKMPVPDKARGGETPREREEVTSPGSSSGGAGIGATPRMPKAPSPVAMEPPVAPAMGPFDPLESLAGDPAGPDPTLGTFVPTSQRRSLLGGAGGLTGGGLGVPFDPTSNQESPDITSLIQLLLRGR